jgi:DNA primase
MAVQENRYSGARPAGRRSGQGPGREQKALWEKQCLLLTWIVDEPAVFSQVRQYLQPEDFDGERYVQTARLVWDRLYAGAESVNAASLISSFETQEEQEAAAAMLNMRLEGVEDRNDRAKTLRELVYFIKQASMNRITQTGGAGSLQSLLEAKQQLQALRSARFQL